MSQSDEETTYIEYTSLALHLADEYFLNNNSRFRSILFVLISMKIITWNGTIVFVNRIFRRTEFVCIFFVLKLSHLIFLV
jgi:hypothetical protein